jgi:hypothetical protein
MHTLAPSVVALNPALPSWKVLVFVFPLIMLGRTMVCAEHYYPTPSPHANGQERNLPLQLSLQPPPQCTPKRYPPNPPRAI